MRRKKNKNQKIDIYRALMLPLMTMFLLNIGLIATTWAWYTASVSSGVNEIKAGADLTVTVKNEEQEIQSTNGKYVLPSGDNTIQLTGGSATNGYVVLMNIEDGDTTSTASSIIDLFFTPVYAQETIHKYYVVLSDSSPKSINVTVSSEKTLSISCLWKENDDVFISDIGNQGYQTISGETINLKSTSYTINLTNEEGTPLKQSEVMSSSSPYSENTGSDEAAVITVDDAEKTEIEMPVIEGYELISVNGEAPKESYQLVEGQENVFNAVYKKIEETTEQNQVEEEIEENNEETNLSEGNTESNNVTVEEEGTNTESTEQTDPVEPNCSTEETAPASDPVQIQQTVNTEQEQPTTEPQQESASEVETVGQDPVVQSEDTTIEENTEVLEDDTNEVKQ